MNERTLTVLEYYKITAMLAERARCCIGKELALALLPQTGIESISRELALTEEAEGYLYRSGMSPVDDFPDMRLSLKRMRAALALSPSDLLGAMRCLRAVRLARERLVQEDKEPSLLSNMASSIAPHRAIEEEISRCILGEDEIADGASARLASIRHKMRQVNERVRDRLNAMIRGAYAKYLQEPIVTIRNGRYVLPVRQEYRQYVSGLIHDQSGSGATLFVEPAAVVELGNEYKKLVAEETAEIERILAELTALLAPVADQLRADLDTLGRIDLCFAKAELAKAYHATRPGLNQDGYIRIVQGRHPLIAQDRVVPIDVWIGKDFNTLIITGPNTGGKTVTLKTVGLFTLMMQAGMFVPAGEGTQMSTFEDVFADIGDEQSIEQSLSTFSSHMTNIVGILSAADERSLVLLDELGAGTDPVEGAALAMSILEELHGRGTMTVATTHYSEIKAFALTREGFENASMEFDVDRLCPTYRLFIGIPGRSNAFEISERLGLNKGIIETARKFLKSEDIKFEDVISSAESQRRIAEEERELAKQARTELEALRREAEAEQKRMAQERERFRAKAREDARRIVSETRQETERIIEQLRAAGKTDQRAAERTIQQSRDALRKQEEQIAEPIVAAERPGKPPKTVKPGDAVRVVSLNVKAAVLAPPDAKGEVQVQAGVMKLSVKLSDLLLEHPRSEERSGARVSMLSMPSVPLELDLRGMLVEDAVLEVDRYLDNAKLCGRNEVSIIHGKGTGALRAGIQEYLKRHPNVKSFRLGAYGEGDAGVTVVTLK
ncbi:MAG: endonuclease MutS2 [Bacillota bacterium]